MTESIIQLKCNCNNYPWGKQGSQSLAAQLCSKTPGTDFRIDESKPYAEMWMGTYPELPSFVLDSGEDLQDVLDRNSEKLIGKNVINKFGHTKLPFLPKVLSMQKALPVQLHPNREMAAKLHEKDPSNFTDPNHKPEIALALGPFEAFAGFKPLDSIRQLMDQEHLRNFLPAGSSNFTNETLRQVVNTVLKANDADIARAVEALEGTPKDKFGKDSYIPDMASRLKQQYDVTDPGIIIALITMNYLKLSAGQCISVPADGIHAWLSGDIIECMARSNNVLNTGFCPAAERNSADLFTSCLTFSPHSTDEAFVQPKKFNRAKNGKTKLYQTEMSEFDVLNVDLGKGEDEVLAALGGPAIFFVARGSGKLQGAGKEHELSEGYVFFVGQGTELHATASANLSLYVAFVE